MTAARTCRRQTKPTFCVIYTGQNLNEILTNRLAGPSRRSQGRRGARRAVEVLAGQGASVSEHPLVCGVMCSLLYSEIFPGAL